MAQILIQISDELLRALDRVAPASSRRRSRFIRLALTRALMEVQDIGAREAYRRVPDDDIDWFDPRLWDEWKPRRPRKRSRRKSRSRA